MLSSEGFDLWADGYDKCVSLSEEDNAYPFAGYKDVLGTVYKTIKEHEGTKVLDVGFGTGILSQKLYREGYGIYGIDFSEKMIEIAQKKMPEATLIKHDFTEGCPASLETEKFDFIVCTYAIHHLEDCRKVPFMKELLRHLSDGGFLLIGDVAFEKTEDMEKCKNTYKDEWDDEEFYMVAETFSPLFPHMEYRKITFCSGVFLMKA